MQIIWMNGLLPSNISSLAVFQVKGGPTLPNAGRYFHVRKYKNLKLLNEKTSVICRDKRNDVYNARQKYATKMSRNSRSE